ncbi:helix-turn-helix transcriptional regulator [Lentilactobacillus sp. TOM.63]|uniref:helix-turn-helix domain-containing protein n=2 Tax=Lactobacillaceae TaxID=33958 RepID=UPI001C26E15D|nr:helix-turn-helix transcriptional regulator [Lentilactobacillus sp. TOM.63]MBU9789570.1 helix-turn-helix domain-containing protein [Lentilactobacillus dabitei]MDM7517239.1 helix-turn-helix transcriptional regulator [Lentilactobacillus sp. TOM.63]
MGISTKLKQFRKNKQMTQQDVAAYLHVSRKTISGWENDRSYPDASMLIKLSDLFGISVDNLIRDAKMTVNDRPKEQRSRKRQTVFIATYRFNIVLLIVGYLHMYYLPGFHSAITTLILLINELAVFLSYESWINLKRRLTLLEIFGSFFILLAVNIVINFLNSSWNSSIVQSGTYEALGMMIGRVILDMLLSISLIMVIFFRPLRNKKWWSSV